jgi:GntR family transcriptional regulator, rspAB operon transcriptional repressor
MPADWTMPKPARKSAARATRAHAPQAAPRGAATRRARAPAGGVLALPRADRNRRAATAAESIYRILRDEIVWLRRAPGEPIAEMEIAAVRKVSRTPVREALLRLAAEGLVDTVAKSGTFVARIPLAQLPEAIVVRKALEEVTARAAAGRARRSDVLALRAVLERQEEAAAADDRLAFHRDDEAFHAAVAAAAGYPGIWTLVQGVKTQIDRYRLLTLPQPGRMRRVIREHAAVVDAIERGDADAAAAAMQGHLDGLRISMEDIRRVNPDFFYEDVGLPHAAGPQELP